MERLKGLYAELNVMPSLQDFVNDKGKKIDNGFQIFNTYRVGHHIKLFKDRFFINHLLQLLTVLITQKCLMDLNSLTINGQNLSPENRDFILDLIFSY